MLLVSVTGGKGHGKGEVAASIARWAFGKGLTVVERGFADAGKLSMARIFWPTISLEEALAWSNQFKNDPNAVINVYGATGKLVTITGRQRHLSPFEHVATPAPRDGMFLDQQTRKSHTIEEPADQFFGNFRGWVQMRQEIPYQENFGKLMEAQVV